MKIIFKPIDKQLILNQLQEVASKYNTEVKLHETGGGHFIFVKSRIKISEKIRDNVHAIHVWGANQDDLNFLREIWGEPFQVITERLTPLEFIAELSEIPNIEKMTIEEIIQTLDITENEYGQFERYIQRSVKRPNASPEMKKASELLKK